MKNVIFLFLFFGLGSHLGFAQVATSLSVIDSRSTYLPPSNYGKEVRFEFKERSVMGLSGSEYYGGTMTFAPWSDNSGGTHHQLGFIDQFVYYRNGYPQSSSWGSWQQFVLANSAGNVGIGTSNPGYKLDVIGTVRAREVKVDMSGADFVFEPDYSLIPLKELEHFITQRKHLPGIQPAAEMQASGVNLGEFNTQLLQKIEELTLYLIQQDKRIEDLTKEKNSLEDLLRRVEALERN